MSHYDPRQPGQYPAPHYIPPAPKKMPLWAKLIIGLVGVPMLLIGGCTAIVLAGGAAEVADDEPVITETYDPGINTPETKPTETTAQPAPTTVPSPKATRKAHPPMTTTQEQAVGTAESYLRTMPFSRSGLIEQLEYEGFARKDATFGVDKLRADWNEQAARMAHSYLRTQHFSRRGLIDQLEYEGFTTKQATYGVTKAGL